MNKIYCNFDIETSKLSCEIPLDKFKSIKENHQGPRYYKVVKKVPRLNDVAIKTQRSVKLKDIKEIKLNYYNTYKQLIEAIQTKKKIKKVSRQRRVIKLATVFVLFLTIMSVSILSQSKEVKVIIDGKVKEVETNQFISSIFVDKVAQKYHIEEYEYHTSDDFSLKTDSVIVINSLKEIDVKVDGVMKNINTYTNNVEDFIAENEAKLLQGKDKDKYSLYYKTKKSELSDVPLENQQELELFYLSKKVKTKKIVKDYKVKYVETSKLASGSKKVKQKGQDKIYLKEYTTTYLNDKKYSQKVSTKKVIQKGQDKIILLGTKTTAPTGLVWDRLAKCETGGRWHANTGNGYYGGLQFSAGTWKTAASKVGVSAPYAHLASKSEQIKAATWLQKNSGWGQWPHCSAKLGLK